MSNSGKMNTKSILSVENSILAIVNMAFKSFI